MSFSLVRVSTGHTATIVIYSGFPRTGSLMSFVHRQHDYVLYIVYNPIYNRIPLMPMSAGIPVL